jgi:flagellar hook-associated protein 1 FlgK
MAAGSLLGIGVSGLLANQASLRAAGHNVSNTDTPGYSRQSVLQAAQNPAYSGAGYQGTGVKVDAVRRIVDEYAVNQLRMDTSAFNELDSYLSNISQVDSLLADSSTGLAPAMQEFFAALHAGADDPTSIPVRQLVLSQAQSLDKRFETIQTRLAQQGETVNLQLDTITTEITSIARSLAGLNESIVAASGRGQADAPNDLLDKRDELVRQLAKLVAVNVVAKEQNGIDVFIGSGQALVIGGQANVLSAVAGTADSAQFDLVFDTRGQRQTVTNSIRGGQLGGLLDFRNEVLGKTMNSMGRIALTVSAKINESHQLGLDLGGNFGQNLFTDVNSRENALSRILANKGNDSGIETRLSVEIDDPTLLTDTDYQLSFPGPGSQRFVITRVDNDTVVNTGVLSGVVPDSLSFDGLTVNFEAGQIQAGDKFLIQPTRYAASQMKVELERPEQLAFASAISGAASLSNDGTGKVVNTEALDVTTSAFALPGTLAPPLLIRFTSATTYDVLDNSNPARPTDLRPPLTSLSFTPGIRNQMLPDRDGQTAATSAGDLAGRLPTEPVLTPALTPVTNGYVNEAVNITTINPASGILSVAPPVVINAGESAASIAQKLSAVHGVNASARTRLQVSNFVNQASGTEPMVVSINGIELTPLSGEPVPSFLSPNYLADLVDADPRFAALGITARSDGDTLTLESLSGEDLSVRLRGDTGDSVTLTDVHANQLVMQGAGGSVQGQAVANEVKVGGVLTVVMEEGVSLSSNSVMASGNLFEANPVALSTYLGYQLTLDGNPAVGDEFNVEYNADGVSDNRNVLAMLLNEHAKLVEKSSVTLLDSYGRTVEFIGAATAQAQINSESSESLMQQSQAKRDSISGVNLDEEAADLIRYEQAYNASAQVVSIARSLFDTLLNTFR